MALRTAQSLTTIAAAPVPITPDATETITAESFGSVGVNIQVTTTGTPTDVAVQDPTFSQLSNPGTVTPQTMPATGTREWIIPRNAVSPSSGVATVTFSGARTGVTYTIKRHG